ncbi:hypothetical protein SapgrDRAFT_0874 [Saprospira grandis DSM 2844]|uniref:Secretion system C-terminal sorting domain-containing protein n=1 Tax=Saprospira grandis DSM 2844 TaxID=694433 RepID=J0NYN9_9BACT|nr:hypothetical protein [Saprospira grandis]EJF52609.1 hypothetical protein SapgrDRAFT_0874 [Saprospira grandis DSM 2844]
MKKLSSFLLAAAVLFTMGSCGSDNQQAATAVNIKNVNSTRGVQTVQFQGADVAITAEDVFVVEAKKANAKQSEDAVNDIHSSLMSAEKEDQLAGVELTMEDKAVDDMFVFGLKAEEAKNVMFEMYDEEGFELAANNKFSLNQGHNYKALNVTSLEEGKYFFKLKDEAGKEMTNTVVIKRD